MNRKVGNYLAVVFAFLIVTVCIILAPRILCDADEDPAAYAPTVLCYTTAAVKAPTIKHYSVTITMPATTTTEETTQPESSTIANIEESTTESTSKEPEYTYYYVCEYGEVCNLDEDLQRYGQDLIRSLGIEEYIPYWYAQCYQESNFHQSSVGRAHGGYHDWGIMQIWEGLEHDPWSCLYNVIPNYPDYKTDPYDNIACGIYQFYYWYQRYGSIRESIGSYFSGVYGQPSEKYINDVYYHLDYIYEK